MIGKFIDRPREDSLTAAVFGHLLHLPTEIFWQILRQACYGDDILPRFAGEPTDAQAWPAWDARKTRNARRVIPDLFIRFDEFDLIIEAKRWDHGMQSKAQWQDQLAGYANEYGEEKRKVFLIALGGLHGTAPDEVTHQWDSAEAEGKDPDVHLFICPVVMCRWQRLLEQCKRMLRELERLHYRDSRTFANTRILEDIVSLFALHRYSTGKWFADFAFSANQLSSSLSPSHQILQARSKVLSRK